jgi:hypothetical protein
MREFAGECGRRYGQDRALGVGQAITAYPGEDHPGQGAAAAGAYDQHIPWAAGKINEHPAGWAPLDVRLHQRIIGNLPPRCEERVLQPRAVGGFRVRSGAAGVTSQVCSPLDGQASALVRGSEIAPFLMTHSLWWL